MRVVNKQFRSATSYIDGTGTNVRQCSQAVLRVSRQPTACAHEYCSNLLNPPDSVLVSEALIHVPFIFLCIEFIRSIRVITLLFDRKIHVLYYFRNRLYILINANYIYFLQNIIYIPYKLFINFINVINCVLNSFQTFFVINMKYFSIVLYNKLSL